MTKQKDNSMIYQTGGGSMLSSLMLILYIILKYPLKYTILFYLLYLFIRILKITFLYGCKALNKIKKFFKKILECAEFGNKKNKCTLDLIFFKIPNLFHIFIAFIDVFIGSIYACICLILLCACALVTIPFNYLIAW